MNTGDALAPHHVEKARAGKDLEVHSRMRHFRGMTMTKALDWGLDSNGTLTLIVNAIVTVITKIVDSKDS